MNIRLIDKTNILYFGQNGFFVDSKKEKTKLKYCSSEALSVESLNPFR
jgi:hypothetical protein